VSSPFVFKFFWYFYRLAFRAAEARTLFANLQKVLIPSSQLCKTVFYGLAGFYLSYCNKGFICLIHSTLNNSLPIYHSKPLLLFLHFCKQPISRRSDPDCLGSS